VSSYVGLLSAARHHMCGGEAHLLPLLLHEYVLPSRVDDGLQLAECTQQVVAHRGCLHKVALPPLLQQQHLALVVAAQLVDPPPKRKRLHGGVGGHVTARRAATMARRARGEGF
jgi:hypothetical protein